MDEMNEKKFIHKKNKHYMEETESGFLNHFVIHLYFCEPGVELSGFLSAGSVDETTAALGKTAAASRSSSVYEPVSVESSSVTAESASALLISSFASATALLIFSFASNSAPNVACSVNKTVLSIINALYICVSVEIANL